MGNPASLMASLIGGEGARDPSKGLENMLGPGTAMGGIDETEDLDGDGEPDHLVETGNKIDDYLAKQWLLGKRKLTVSVNYGNMPLEYQYLHQCHIDHRCHTSDHLPHHLTREDMLLLTDMVLHPLHQAMLLNLLTVLLKVMVNLNTLRNLSLNTLN